VLGYAVPDCSLVAFSPASGAEAVLDVAALSLAQAAGGVVAGLEGRANVAPPALLDAGDGYRLSSKITVRDADDPANAPQSEPGDPPNDPVNGRRDPVNDPLNGADDPANNERQQWALGRMHVGRELRKADVADHFECSKETARRDLKDLRRRGIIEFIGPSKTGYWRLVR